MKRKIVDDWKRWVQFSTMHGIIDRLLNASLFFHVHRNGCLSQKKKKKKKKKKKGKKENRKIDRTVSRNYETRNEDSTSLDKSNTHTHIYTHHANFTLESKGKRVLKYKKKEKEETWIT